MDMRFLEKLTPELVNADAVRFKPRIDIELHGNLSHAYVAGIDGQTCIGFPAVNFKRSLVYDSDMQAFIGVDVTADAQLCYGDILVIFYGFCKKFYDSIRVKGGISVAQDSS